LVVLVWAVPLAVVLVLVLVLTPARAPGGDLRGCNSPSPTRMPNSQPPLLHIRISLLQAPEVEEFVGVGEGCDAVACFWYCCFRCAWGWEWGGGYVHVGLGLGERVPWVRGTHFRNVSLRW
jgi:hypothetical protein